MSNNKHHASSLPAPPFRATTATTISSHHNNINNHHTNLNGQQQQQQPCRTHHRRHRRRRTISCFFLLLVAMPSLVGMFYQWGLLSNVVSQSWSFDISHGFNSGKELWMWQPPRMTTSSSRSHNLLQQQQQPQQQQESYKRSSAASSSPLESTIILNVTLNIPAATTATTFLHHPTTTTNTNTTITLPFHRWGNAAVVLSNHTAGIPMEPFGHYVQHLASLSYQSDYDLGYGPVPAYIDANVNLVLLKQVYQRRRGTVRERLGSIGPFWHKTLQLYKPQLLLSTPTTSSNPFPFLSQALQEGGLPLIFSIMDYTGCLYHNYNYTARRRRLNNMGEASVSSVPTVTVPASIPMFTLSSSPRCNYAFPIPSYTTLAMAKDKADDWDAVFTNHDQRYPWNTKIAKAVWRGAPSGMAKWKTSILDIPRVYLNYMAKNHTDIMDVAVPCSKRCRIKMSWQGWLILGHFMPMEDFQNYRAVLDLDGNSWSERFPKLLCQNSVVIKVEPEQIDYFWPTLQAGVHFVAANFSNLVSVVEYVIADAHQEEMQRIVANAHQWCRQHMVVRQIQEDIMNVLNGYAEELYKADRHWRRHIPQLRNWTYTFPYNWRARSAKTKRK